MQAQGNLSLSSKGKVTNHGAIKSNGQLSISANTIENAVDGSLESQQTQLEAVGVLNNYGLINGSNTYVKAGQLNNIAGRIYGDHIAIQANTLNNQSLNGLAPVIASRGDLDLGVQVLNNLENNLNHQSGSQIIAMGDLRIGGSLDSQWHAQGTAQQVNNRSSVINANGNIDLNADIVNNQNVFFTTKQQQTTEEFWVKSKQNSEDLNEINMPSKKGFFIYHSLEGDNAGKDYPVGYNRETKIGDYFRYLMPTVYASINDFPTELHHGIAVSDTVDFTADRLFDNEKISEYFPKCIGNT